MFDPDLNVATAEATTLRRECGVCWNVYDPQVGDPMTQVPPGTPFEALPEHWCCPNCEAPKHKFMIISDG